MKNQTLPFLILIIFTFCTKEKQTADSVTISEIESTTKSSSKITLDTNTFYINWIKYIDSNNVQSGELIYDALPNKIVDFPEAGNFRNECSMISESRFSVELVERSMLVLENRIKEKDTLALKIRIKMESCFWGGAWSEWMDMSVGNLITKDPELFLKFVKRHLHFFGGLKNLGGVSSNLLEYMDDEDSTSKRYEVERQLRIEKLKTVTNPELLEIRDSCLSHLEKE